MENKIKNRPKVRFDGFVEEWEIIKLGKVLQLENGYAFKGEHFKDYATDFIVLTPGSVNLEGGFQKGKGRFYDISGKFPSRFIFKPGEIFVTMTDLTPTAQTLGLPAIVPNNDKTYLHNQRLGKLINFEGNQEFLFQLLSNPKNQKKIVLTASGTTVKHTSPSKILNCLNGFPSPTEQKKIGNYFQTIDQLIEQQQQKHDKLRILKKAMLAKMFPKEGATTPEIRFKGFTEEWVEKRLKEISTYHSSSLTVSDAKSNGKNELYDVNNVIGFTNQNIQLCDYITIIKDGSGVGRIRLLPKNTSFIATMGAIHNANVDIYFLFHCLSRTDFRQHINGATIPHIYYSDYGNNIYYIPSIQEQTLIGSYFKNLDHLINQHKEKIAKLKQLKKACLHQMFV